MKLIACLFSIILASPFVQAQQLQGQGQDSTSIANFIPSAPSVLSKPAIQKTYTKKTDNKRPWICTRYSTSSASDQNYKNILIFYSTVNASGVQSSATPGYYQDITNCTLN